MVWRTFFDVVIIVEVKRRPLRLALLGHAQGCLELRHWFRSREDAALAVAEPPELFQLKCLSHASGAVTHLNRNNPSVPQI